MTVLMSYRMINNDFLTSLPSGWVCGRSEKDPLNPPKGGHIQLMFFLPLLQEGASGRSQLDGL